MKIRVKIGDVFQIPLPNGKYAYGRIYNGAGAGIYNKITDEPNNPPIGLRDFMFNIYFQDDVVEKGLYPIVGKDPFGEGEDDWAPPRYRYDNLFKQYFVFKKGKMYKATEEQCKGLETTQLWGIEEVIERIMKTIEEKK